MSVRHSNYLRVGEPPVATVDENQRYQNPVMLTTVIRRVKNEPYESRPVKPAFRKDFVLEHSRFGKQADSVEFVHYF